MVPMALARILLATPLLFVSACGDPLLLGSDLVWSADHESSDLSEWSSDLRGGAYPGAQAESAIEVVTERARSGRYAVKLVRPDVSVDAGPLLYREIELPSAFYGAWFNVPEVPRTVSYWTIAQFRALPAADSDAAPHGVNLNLRSLPGGELVLSVFDNHATVLQVPLTDPPPLVPVDEWFHVEARYDGGGTESGRLVVWLNGRRVYEVSTGPLIGDGPSYFMIGNGAKRLEPSPVSIYVDDVVISRSRITPEGLAKLE